MKTLKITLNENGGASIDEKQIYFDKESGTVCVKIEYPQTYKNYDKRCDFVSGSGRTTFKVGEEFILTSHQLEHGYLNIQPIATLDDKIAKWEIINIYVNKSLNVLEDDTTVTESVVQELFNLINTKMDKFELEPTWENLEKLLKGEI